MSAIKRDITTIPSSIWRHWSGLPIKLPGSVNAPGARRQRLLL